MFQRFWVWLFFSLPVGAIELPHYREIGNVILDRSISDATGWDVTGAGSWSAVDGNAAARSYNGQVMASHAKGKDETFLRADYFYANDNGIDVMNSLRVGAQQNRMIQDARYVGVSGTFLNDEIAGIDYRADLSFLAGFYALKKEKVRLSFESGVGYAWQELGTARDEYVSLRFAQRFSYRIFSNSKIWQSMVIEPRANHYFDHLLSFDVGIDTQISQNWAIRTQLRQQIDTTPALGQRRSDQTITLGLAYSLKGVPAIADDIQFPNLSKAKRKKLAAIRTIQKRKSGGWQTTFNLRHVMANGNSRTKQFSLDVMSAYYAKSHEWLLKGTQRLSENRGKRTGDRLTGDLQWNLLREKNQFWGANLSYFQDQATNVNYRATPNLLYGKYLQKSDSLRWSVEIGPGMVLENAADTKTQYASVQAASRFEWMINEKMTLGMSNVANAKATNFQNFVTSNHAYFDVDVTTRLSWRTALSFLYDEMPTRKLERHDTVLSGGVSWRF